MRVLVEEEERDIRLEKRRLQHRAWGERYDWLEEGKLAEILARLEIGACINDDHMEVVEEQEECETMELDLMENQVMDM